jgi:hypothetical protein
MHKVKKAIQTLQKYLGRDKEALRLLEAVANIANELRVQLAAAVEEACKAEAMLASVGADKITAEQAAAKLRRELEQARAKRASGERLIRSLQDQVASLEQQLEPEDLELELAETTPEGLLPDIGDFLSLFKQLRRDYAKSPRGRGEKPTGHGSFLLEDLIEDLGTESMLKLGRFVAVVALSNFPCTVSAVKTMVDVYRKEDDARHFVYWFRTNIGGEAEWREQLRAKAGW